MLFTVLGIGVTTVSFFIPKTQRTREVDDNGIYHTIHKQLPPYRTGARILGMALILGGAAYGSVGYLDAGRCVHIRTIFGTESASCSTGWYASLWGRTTEWNHFMTVAHTADPDAEGSSILPPYNIRMADNWAGTITQTTRFGIPQDDDQFLKMARDFRSPERLITSTLRPAITASLDSTANLFTMEEYYAGGRRDDFKTEYRDAVIKGRALIERVEKISTGPNIDRDTSPSEGGLASDTASTGGAARLQVITNKKLDASGNEMREPHGFATYGITVSTAILQNLDPDDAFEEQIKARKEASARRSIAKEQRLEEEEQRLLALAKAEREIATRQGESRVRQIELTTDAETEKRLALTRADQRRGEARIAKETAQLNFERAQIDAKSVEVTADATAYEKAAVLEADGALQRKLDAMIQMNADTSNAFANITLPSTIIGGGSEGGAAGLVGQVANLISLMNAERAKTLNLDMAVK